MNATSALPPIIITSFTASAYHNSVTSSLSHHGPYQRPFFPRSQSAPSIAAVFTPAAISAHYSRSADTGRPAPALGPATGRQTRCGRRQSDKEPPACCRRPPPAAPVGAPTRNDRIRRRRCRLDIYKNRPENQCHQIDCAAYRQSQQIPKLNWR